MQPVYHIGAYSGGWVVLSCRHILMSSYGDQDQCHQKWHSAIQPARFNASLLMTVSSLHVMKAPAAERTTRETSSKHMWSVLWWKGFAENQGNVTWVGLLSLPCWALIYVALRRRWRQGYWTGIEALQDIRENLTVASQNQRHKISQICVLKSINEEKKQQGTRCDDKCLIRFELYLAAWVGFDTIKLKYRPDEWD